MRLVIFPIIIGIIVTSLVSYADANTFLMSPLQQIKSGVLPQDVTCEANLTLIINSETSQSACVKFTSEQKLLERGWVTPEEFDKMQLDAKSNIIITPKQQIVTYGTGRSSTNIITQNSIVHSSTNTAQNNNATSSYNDQSNHPQLPIHNGYYTSQANKVVNVTSIGCPTHCAPSYPAAMSERPLPELNTVPVISTTEPNIIKILAIGMSANPLKVGDKTSFTVTFQNISNGTIYFMQDMPNVFFLYSISPSNDVMEMPMHIVPRGADLMVFLGTNQTVTVDGLSSNLHGYYQIINEGELNVNMQLGQLLDKSMKEFDTTIQFNVNATQ